MAGLLPLGSLAFLGWFAWSWSRQGLAPDELDPGQGARVDLDEHGVPTIVATNWSNLASAQGYTVASERLWQMDLMRRAAGGGLSEWFGSAAISADLGQLQEDWPGVARGLAEHLPEDQRESCDAYAEGVNRFITRHPDRWGIEYTVLRAEPEPWTCADSMLILLAMARDLSASSDDDLALWGWRAALDEDWERFLFPEEHPWSRPLFGQSGGPLALPTRALPRAELPPGFGPRDHEITPGSNSWAWRGSSGALLANDPHLGANVPHLWYLVRLYISPQDWVVGSAIPGVPGVVLGMNPALAWTFTNTHEDVDDRVIEEIDAAQQRYVSRYEEGPDGTRVPVWREIERRQLLLEVKGEDPVPVVARFTERGPLSSVDGPEGPVLVSRLWLPFQDPAKVAHNPGFLFARARSLDALQGAIDRFRFPSQNVLAMDRAGAILYRSSGLGVLRQSDGATPGPAATHAWLGLAPPSERPRLLIPADAPGPVHLETANNRVWVGPWHEGWDSDGRVARIRTLLDGRDDLTPQDMQRVQMDTHSRLLQMLVQWTAKRHTPLDGMERDMAERWERWDGYATSDPRVFTEALAVQGALEQTLLRSVRRHLLPPALKRAPYAWGRSDAWVLRTLGLADPSFYDAIDWERARAEEVVSLFGLSGEELAAEAVRAAAQVRELYTETNRWAAQHPFVDRVPLLGPRFAIGTPEQVGFSDLVRSERPRGGASARFVWDLIHPENSTWITPVGQSGHVRSIHYADLQPLFHADQRLPVFDRTHDWGF